jgi:hypothetical protein
MAYPIATTPTPAGSSNPNPAYTGIFIPTIWSGKLIEKFYDATVLAAIANSDYEGEISNQGDKVVIRTKPTIAINDYEANQALVVERPSSNIVELLIDKGKYFNTILDDVMEVQADLNQLSMWADDASEQMKIVIDTDVLAYLAGEMVAANSGAVAGRLSGDVDLGTVAAPLEVIDRVGKGFDGPEAVDVITRLGQVLDEQNIPETGRWLIIPAWMAALIKRSELRDASLVGDSVSMLRNGRLGMIDRFTVYMSNLLPTPASGAGGDHTQVYAGHSHGLTFASQLTKVETLRGESTFGTYLRGLQVYGRKVTDATAIAMARVRKSEVASP